MRKLILVVLLSASFVSLAASTPGRNHKEQPCYLPPLPPITAPDGHELSTKELCQLQRIVRACTPKFRAAAYDAIAEEGKSLSDVRWVTSVVEFCNDEFPPKTRMVPVRESR